MTHKTLSITLLTALAVITLTPVASAAERDMTLELRPACPHNLNESETVFGPIPDVEGYVTLGDDVCPSFHVEDPQTLRTNELQIGDTLAIDIVLENPSLQPVNSIRSWLSYDPALLEGVSVEIQDAFPSVTPGESDFDEENGYVMIEASNDQADANTVQFIRVATVTFRVIATSPAGTPITFYDVQPTGHTSVLSTENGNDEEVLSEIPGSLKVVFGSSGTQNNEEEPVNEQPGEETPLGDEFDSLFQDPNPEESPVEENTETPTQPPAEQTPENTEGSRTSFALLQVRNLRITTDGSTLYLGWEALNHQSLKAYNIYYGTTSGRYIQRKTISGDMTSLVLRALPLGETYYVAIRAVSTSDEESAFSQEVSVQIGNPNTSTAPLAIGSIATGPNGVNPVQGSVTGNGVVPGATGTPSVLAFIVITSAVIGTGIAFRRQGTVTQTYNTHHE